MNLSWMLDSAVTILQSLFRFGLVQIG